MDRSFTGTVTLTAQGKTCNRISFKPQIGIRIKGLVISKITVERVP